ncbi:hypothetical protein Dvar_42120 [Desulfosarcina variabilis str. Montpellier]|uniref:PD-(D/E)XK nuclease family protein n=1 Tax=Desulfosarcina variabilis TaxID=2300 RepID=UPI003AFA426B
MENISIDFFLTPDGPSGRRVRTHLARYAPGLYRIAGPWSELMARAHAAYMLQPQATAWSETLRTLAAKNGDHFWSGSVDVAPEETIAELGAALTRLIEGGGPDANWDAGLDQLPRPSRLRTRISQLAELIKQIGTLPESFQMMADLLSTRHQPLRPIRVVHLPDLLPLNKWQEAVLNRLAKDAPVADSRLQGILNHALEPVKTAKPALLAARSLFASTEESMQMDESVHVLAARDRLEEVEIAAGMIQKAIGRGAPACQWGLLLPNDAFTIQTVEAVFKHYHLPLSGLEYRAWQRDLGREVVYLMLVCLRKPAPVMAIAALLTSALMPWSLEIGEHYAQALMNGDMALKRCSPDDNARRLMGAIDDGAETRLSLRQHLDTLKTLIEKEEQLPDHRQRAMDCIDDVLLSLEKMTDDIDWDSLLARTRPQTITVDRQRTYWKEGIAVFHEGQEPWRRVNHLLVLGFNDGHFPSGSKASAVLTDAEWEQAASTGWAVTTAELKREQQRHRFSRQLGAASDSLTFLFSHRDPGGNTLEASSSLVFLARRFGCAPEDLVLEAGRREDRQKVPELSVAESARSVLPRALPLADIDLKRDLLAAMDPESDQPVALSPSAADTLMVSPFAWLLRRLDCEPRVWGTDALNPIIAGMLAHGVFEKLFLVGRPLIEKDRIPETVSILLNRMMLTMAPFLRGPDWRVERLKLESEIIRAAERWRDLLDAWGATVIGAERWLKGVYKKIPLRGQSDLLLQLPSGKLLVVDYKKSSSKKRRQRMRSKFDLQANLYRLMIQSNGFPGPDHASSDIGVVYYLLDDMTALSDSPIVARDTVPGLEIMDHDISLEAMRHLDRRLDEIHLGRVMLNTTEDEAWWDKNAGIKVYALDNSPLLRLFMHEKKEAS